MIYLTAFLEHVKLVLITLILSFLLAMLISFLLTKAPKIQSAVESVFSAIYSIPSLALFALMIPITGLGDDTAIFVLVIYNQYLLIRNILAGINGIDHSVIESGVGMGMNQKELFLKVIIPLAAPSIIAGIRLAVVSTIGIATIAASINAGGLGTILFSGMRTMNGTKICIGTILCMIIAFIADTGIRWIEHKLDWRYKMSHDVQSL